MMVTNIQIFKSEANISIHVATEREKEKYIDFELKGELIQHLKKLSEMQGIDVRNIIWDERYNRDCIMFAIVENITNDIIGFCEIEHLSTSEPTIGITLAEQYRGKGYGYLAAKMMIEAGWKVFDYPYFVWEVENDNLASKHLAIKLGGKLINNRRTISDKIFKMMQDSGLEISEEDFPESVERYKICRPTKV